MAGIRQSDQTMWLRDLLRRGSDRTRLWRGHDLALKAEFLIGCVECCLPPPGRHLDIACGDGQLLAACNRRGWQSVGIDLNPRRLARAVERGQTAIKADMLHDLCFADESFQLVSLISTLEHVPDRPALLGEVDRVLAPGGAVLVQIPNPRFPIDLHYFLPLYGYLPEALRHPYRRLLAGKRYAISYYTELLTQKGVEDNLAALGYRLRCSRSYVYPREIAPDWLRPLYRLYGGTPLRLIFPTGYVSLWVKPASDVGYGST